VGRHTPYRAKLERTEANVILFKDLEEKTRRDLPKQRFRGAETDSIPHHHKAGPKQEGGLGWQCSVWKHQKWRR
jgi:hypothetical protein